MIEIFAPRYKDNKMLVATYKVCSGINFVKFTKAKHLIGKVFMFNGDEARKCPTQKNGRISVFVVPMEYLKPCAG